MPPPVARLVSAKGWARLLALALIVLAVVVSLLDLRRTIRGSSRPPPAARPADPLKVELLRCQALGQAGAVDPGCLKAWAESRRRFLGGPRS